MRIGSQRETQLQNEPKLQVRELKRSSAKLSLGLLEALTDSKITRKLRVSSEADTNRTCKRLKGSATNLKAL